MCTKTLPRIVVGTVGGSVAGAVVAGAVVAGAAAAAGPLSLILAKFLIEIALDVAKRRREITVVYFILNV